jgi:para-nitrobenzyl esterase
LEARINSNIGTEKMLIRLLGILTLTVLPLAAAFKQPVTTMNGRIEGTPGKDPSITSFKGVPYAAPPVGDLRWQSPQPALSWKSVRQANAFSRSCVQNIARERKPWTYEFLAHNEVGEDCLYLNVWTSASSAHERRPVYVWLYGGGYVEGSTAVPVYDGENLARRGVVVVTVNYRVGVLGFLAHPDLTNESSHNTSGNYGTLDQVAALQWVKANISQFGGDPNNVTVGGQSAGASSVHNLLIAPLGKGLFERAIAESGTGVIPNVRTPTLIEAEQQGVEFAAGKGVHSIKELRALSWQQLTAATPAGTFRFRPVTDGYVLPAPPADVYAAGKQNDVPLLTGWTADEASSAPDYGTIPAAKFREQIESRFGDLSQKFFSLYPVDSGAEASTSEKASSHDQGLVSMYLWGVERAKTSKTRLFTYYWTHAEPGPDAQRYGAFHSSEVPYVFNTLDQSERPWTAEDHKIAEVMGSYWTNFMRTGSPNGRDVPNWPAFDSARPITMELGNHFGPRPVATHEKIRLFEQYFARQNTDARSASAARTLSTSAPESTARPHTK